jgi:hypothetical protein
MLRQKVKNNKKVGLFLKLIPHTYNMAAARNLHLTPGSPDTIMQPLEAHMQILYENYKHVKILRKGNGKVVLCLIN